MSGCEFTHAPVCAERQVVFMSQLYTEALTRR